ncbi:MAG: DEAD/DEAH box helicase family protein [Anaerolineae bacterium]
MLTLKNHQQRALDTLSRYFQLVSQTHDADTAFYRVTRDLYERGVNYNPIAQLRALPYVCLRIPTGGGKTLLACYAISTTAHDLLQQERSVVLWLVPTNTIKDQTLNALRDRQHPYRQALDATLDSRVTVMDLAQALNVTRATLDSSTTIIVSTLAAPRVEDTDSRKVYEENGSLMSHLDGAPPEVLATLEKYPGTETPIPSLANVLKLRRPIVIVDEAHNARTQLAFDTLARFDPACILEFTATPTPPPHPNASNVLYHVSAYELKSEDMIKLPIHLQTHGDWRDALVAAVAKRGELEELATAERTATGEYLRPIALLQAQPRRQGRDTLTVEVVKQGLLDLHIPAEQIAIETGEIREVKQWEEANHKRLSDESCPIRFIITMQALREGWDCPFAYVLCSVAEMGSSTAVEQILGRVLRMPKAKHKQHDGLNYAYALVTSRHFRETAENLADALVSNGFTQFEARNEITANQPALQGMGDLPIFAPAGAAVPPAERGETFHVPQLALRLDGALQVVEESHFLEAWDLATADATLTEAEFTIPTHTVYTRDIDVNARGRIILENAPELFVPNLQLQLRLLMPHDLGTAADLAVWLDRHIVHPYNTQTQVQLFLMRVIERLRTERRMALAELSEHRMALRDAVARKLEQHRQAAMKQAFQAQLFGAGGPAVEVSADCVFSFDPNRYAPNRLYEGRYNFNRHYYRAIGAMNDEELRCAELLDTHPHVQYWVRNVEREPRYSFWLQTATDRFYPDFVARLDDGRVLAVEYKGERDYTPAMITPDAQEKRMLGELWQARSNGRCLFALVGAHDYAARLQNIAPI